jgi:hypothetical protein
MSFALASPQLLNFTERGSGPPLLLVLRLMVTGEMFEPVIDRRCSASARRAGPHTAATGPALP